uniref:C2H2-type domain-containing protein n=1 Tax=Mimivirus LCMiAC01 TaxID=2506608 RepID=A0A481YZV0_9VIRU|nr:MAG: uncharacterized protein LCMiAC01_00290 [Mimivirus LCMiAC01]
MSKKYKYSCDKCQFYANYKSQWNKHIKTEKHKTGKRKPRSDRKNPAKCPKCNYVALNNTNIILHILNNHSTIEERKNGLKHYCEYCDYGTLAKKLYDNHLKTKKHTMMIKLVEKMNK